MSHTGKRLISIDDGSTETGFIPGAYEAVQASMIDEDYHHEINSKFFNKWFQDNLINNIQRPACIIIDNATYHNTITDSTVTKIIFQETRNTRMVKS